MSRRVNYKLDPITDDALSFLKEITVKGKKLSETQIVKNAIINLAIEKGWRKPKRRKAQDNEDVTQ